jgi:hypothetical protein
MASRDRLCTKKRKPAILRKLLTEPQEKHMDSHNKNMESQEQKIESEEEKLECPKNILKTPPRVKRQPSFQREELSNVSPKQNYFILLLLYTYMFVIEKVNFNTKGHVLLYYLKIVLFLCFLLEKKIDSGSYDKDKDKSCHKRRP